MPSDRKPSLRVFLHRSGKYPNQKRSASTPRNLDRIVQDLIGRQGAAIFSGSTNGGSLMAALTHDRARAALFYYPGEDDEDQHYRVIRSESAPKSEFTINVGNTATEVEGENTVALDDMNRIVRHFFETEELCEDEAWVWEVDPG